MAEEEKLKREVLAYLGGHNTISLATVSGGKPWVAALFYAHADNFTLYFLSEPKTRHSQELEKNPEVSATINEDYDDWRKIKGIQLEGKAQKVTSPLEKAKALAFYMKKFPFVKDFIPSPGAILSQMVISGRAFPVEIYKVVPERLFYLDNEKGFSHREELPLK